eukprot:3437741-Rhodomonas_salina.1
MVTAGAAKHNQYHHLERFLSDQYPDHEVHCQSYIISIQVLGVSSYPQAAWLANHRLPLSSIYTCSGYPTAGRGRAGVYHHHDGWARLEQHSSLQARSSPHGRN